MFCCGGVDILGSFSRYAEMGVMDVVCVALHVAGKEVTWMAYGGWGGLCPKSES